MPLSPLDRWLLATLAGGGGLLLLVYLLAAFIRQPARRSRWSVWGLVAALTLSAAALAPAWLIVAVPVAPAPAPAPAPVAAVPDDVVEVPLVLVLPEDFAAALPFAEEAVAPVAEPPAPVAPAFDWSARVPSALRLGFLAGALFFLGRWLLGVVGLERLLRACVPAPAWVQRLAGQRLPGVRVLCSPRVEVPFSCGLFRPTIVLPAGLVVQATAEELGWLLNHETAHLRRGDPRACWLFSLAAALFYPFPWFWALRARLRLDQEYVADAEAVADGPRLEYAEFLLHWTTRPRARRMPAAAVGVLGRSSDLFRRIAMLLRGNTPVETRCPRLWSAAVALALVAVAVLTAGVGFNLTAAPVPEPDKKVEPKKDEPKPDEPKQVVPLPEFPPLPDLDRLLPPNLDPEHRKRLQDEMKRAQDEIRKAMEDLNRQFPGGLPGGFPGGGFPNIQIDPNMLPGAFPIGPGGLRGLGVRGRMEGRLGAQVSQPSATLVEQLDLPKDQGLVLERVTDNSAAAKAGLKPHDILLELAGKPVSNNPADLVERLKEIKADEAVDVVVLRRGKKETVKGLTLPEAKALPNVVPGVVIPNIRIPAIPAIPAIPNVPNFPGGANVSLTVTRNGDNFTAHLVEGNVEMLLKGGVEAGAGRLDEVTITEDGKATKYESIDKVPEGHRGKVRELLEMSATGKTKIIR